MDRLLRLRMNIPGEYRDLWLYKSRLYVWDRFGVMSFVDLDTVARHLAVNHGSAVAALTQTLIFRNDWKAGEQLRSMLSVPDIEDAFLRPFSDRDRIVVEVPSHLFSPSGSEAYPGTVLDTCVYADRVYFGTPDGLLESYIDPDGPERAHRLYQQTDFRVSKIAVRYAAVNASAEDMGLHFARVRFASPSDAAGFKRAGWRRIADYSLSASHAARNLLNYTDASVPSLLRAKVTEAPAHDKARYEEYQVVGYEDAKDLSGITYRAAATATGAGDRGGRAASAGEVAVLGNSNQHLLAARNDRLGVIDITAREDGEIEARPSRGYMNTDLGAVPPAGILETYPVGGGFVVELRDSLHLITKDGGFLLADGPAARVRTFTNSIRYKEVVATVEENTASLTGFHVRKKPPFS
jgi:hypothetical protein